MCLGFPPTVGYKINFWGVGTHWADFVTLIDTVCMRMMDSSGDLQLNVNPKLCRVTGWYLSRKFCSWRDQGSISQPMNDNPGSYVYTDVWYRIHIVSMLNVTCLVVVYSCWMVNRICIFLEDLKTQNFKALHEVTLLFFPLEVCRIIMLILLSGKDWKVQRLGNFKCHIPKSGCTNILLWHDIDAN